MFFRQVIHEDLGCASYLVGDQDEGVAAVIDPQWMVDPYVELARLHGMRIAHICETHNHADHVSGHGRLVQIAGARIHIHELAEAAYPHEPLTDGWTLDLGQVRIEAIHAPGHRPEHTCFLLRDLARGEEPWAVLTGDSLFVGDVARPDLAIEPREGARDLYRSLSERLFSLPDEVEVWPGHLGGSLCGGTALDLKTSSTIGFESTHSRFRQFDTADEFVEDAVATLGAKPPNVELIVGLNQGPLVDSISRPSPLSPQMVADATANGAVVVDARTNEQFDEAHIPGAISVSSQDTGFATKVARVVAADAELVVVAASSGYELAAVDLLAAVGLRVAGYLEGGMTAWRVEGRDVSRIEMLEPEGLAARLDDGESTVVLDVRAQDEYDEAHIPGSLHIPYEVLAEREDELPRDRQIATICSGGKRSGLAASVLMRDGFDNVVHVASGGVGTWRRAGHPVESS